MFSHQRGFGILACSCILALLTSGLLHSVISHGHGDEHHEQSGGESSVWTSMHGALHFEQKKLLIATVTVFETALMYVLATLATTITFAFSIALVRSRDPSLGELLRRGIHPYRKFG